MTRLSFKLSVLLLLSTLAVAQEFTLSQFLNVQYANRPSYNAQGTETAYITNISGEPQVWIRGDRVPAPRQVTFEPDGVDGVWWSPANAAHMIIAASRGGNERTKLYMMTPGYTPLMPVTPVDDDAIYRFGCWSKDGTRFCYSSTRRNGVDFDIYDHFINEKDAVMVLQADGDYTAEDYSPDNRYMAILKSHSNVNADLLLYDRESGETKNLTEHVGDVFYGSPQFDKEGLNIYVLTNRDREFVGIAKYNLASGEWSWIETPEADIDVLTLSPDGTGYAYSENMSGLSGFNFVNVAKDKRVGAYRLPEGIIRDMEFSPDSRFIAITYGSATKPFDVWAYDPRMDLMTRLTTSATGGVPSELFVSPELIEFESFDKLKVPAFFYRPQNMSDKTPVIIAIHGGPESQARPDLSGLFQYLLNQGYAILEPNVRGSSGFGRNYISLDNVRKRMDSVKDIEYAAKWLGKQKGIDKNKIVLYGGSYGGFMVLAGLTNYPDLFAAGIDVVGISNFVSFLENTGKYRRALREAEYGSLENDREFLQEISPLNHADKIKAPLLVIQGANDPRVPQSEADQIVESIKNRGGVVEYLLYPDEGHGLRKTENKLDAYGKMAEFLKTHVAK
jgi:dipeptidyl aminopeptidase/acylaminoacyl peptidase